MLPCSMIRSLSPSAFWASREVLGVDDELLALLHHEHLVEVLLEPLVVAELR